MPEMIAFENLGFIRGKYQGRSIVHCHGVFDLFHIGHLRHLKSAKQLGEILVVTITPDRFVNKGPNRPRFSEEQRLTMLANIEGVDYVAINKYPTAVEAIKTLKPDFYVKGPDYQNMAGDITGGILEEEMAVKNHGGQIVFTQDAAESSSSLLNEYFSSWEADQQTAINRAKQALSHEELVTYINHFSSLNVLVIGEPIVDTYVFCSADGIASKSPTISARYLHKEDYAGGSLAIANHLAALGCNVTLCITHGGEPYFKQLLSSTLNPNVRLEEIELFNTPTPQKTRYLTQFQGQRVFELTNLDVDPWSKNDSRTFRTKISENAPKHDIIIVADFGHGMFEGAVLDEIAHLNSFIALNVQTNSSNFGFNPFTKHERWDYLSIDERECRLGMHDRLTPKIELAKKVFSYNSTRPATITLGTEGSIFYDGDGQNFLCPTFFKGAIDTTGAGDAYFAISALLVKLGAPGSVIPLVGNCYAGLKTQIIGNKAAVPKSDLVRALTSLLK